MNNPSSSYPPPGGGPGINPALLASFSNQPQPKQKYPSSMGAVNPAHLMNGMGMMGPMQGVHPSMNPAQLLQQQQQIMNGMGSNVNMMPMGGSMGINPAALTSSHPQSNPSSQFQSQQHHSSTNPQLSSAQNAHISAVMGVSPQQFQALSPQERQQKMMLLQQHQMRERERHIMSGGGSGGGPGGPGGMNINPNMNMNMGAGSGQQQQQQQPQQFRDQQQAGINISGMGMGAQQAQQGGVMPFRDQSMGMQGIQQQHQQQQSMMGMGGVNMGMGMYGAQNQNTQSQSQPQNQAQNQTQQQNTQNQNQELVQAFLARNAASPSASTNTSGGGGSGGYYDRPSSRAGPAMNMTPAMNAMNTGMGMNPNANMPPPAGLPRPGMMGGAGQVGMSMNPMNMRQGMGMAMGMRPPSRATGGTDGGGVGVNGFKAQTQVNPYPQQQQGQGGQGLQYGAQHQQQQPSQQHQTQHPPQHQQPQSQSHPQQPQSQPQHSQQPHQSQPQHPQQQPQQHQHPQPPQPPQQSHHQLHQHQPHPQQQQQQPPPRTNASSPFPTSGTSATSASPPMPSSPYRGAKRKVGLDASPRMGVIGLGPSGVGGPMGPPSVPPRSLSAASSSGHGSVSGERSGEMNGYMGSQGQGQRSPSSSVSMPGGVNGVNVGMGMGMGGMTAELPLRHAQPSLSQPQPQQQQQQQQRQPSLPRQGSVAPKQGSVPPPDSGVVPPSTSTPAPALAPTSGSAVPAPAASTPPTTTTTAPTMPYLPPLPANVTLNPSVTRVKIVPLINSVSLIPPLSDEEISDVKEWMEVDKVYEGVYKGMKERMTAEAKDALYGWGKGGWWEKGGVGGGENVWGNRWRKPREPFDVRYPRTRREREGRGRRGTRREGLRLPRTLRDVDTDRPEQLVPIRLEFDVEHHKMRDTFVWNLNDPIVTPENFAQTVVEDYNLSANYHAVIVKSINDQLTDFKAHSGLYDADGAELSSPILGIVGVGLKPGEDTLKEGVLDEENGQWWGEWRKRLKVLEKGGSGRKVRGKKRRKMKEEDGEDGDVEDGFGMDAEDKVMKWEKPLPLEEIDVNEQMMHEDMRILIRLDIIVGSMKLDDQFEWDLDNDDASPEDFAEVYTQELGLNGEFRTAIAHSIREQVQTYQKSLFLVGHPSDGSPVQDEDLRSSFLPSLSSAARPTDQVPSFTPLLNYLSDGEIERNEKERDKDMNRRRKRNTRGRRGIALPDREPIRTYRTPAIGFPELDAATLALAAAANAPMSRRAAAAAASVTIANMVASENGTAFLPQMPSTMVPQPPPMVVKEKKTAKGHFKAPPFSPSVLRARAQVAAPTVSTAADVSKLPPPLENDPPPAPPPMATAVSGGASTSESKAVKVITAKRAKELEREAKEKEFADGQHANFIDGVWHCSNCGCPENIAIGRRKGPLGDKSQCGTCGKFWHRHRRPRPVEYNTDPDFHSGIKRDAEVAKTTAAAKKRGGAAALRAQSATVPATPAETSGTQTPSRSNGDVEVSSRLSPGPGAGLEDDRAISPVSTASSGSEPPLAQRLKLNGLNSHTSAPAPSTPTPSAGPHSANKADPPSSRAAPTSTNAAGSAPTSPTRPWPPQWLTSAKEAMKAKYPNDKFEIILRKVNATSSPEWRIKCLDCPGKLYTPGPGETLSNYEVHLKNRQHRQRVNERLNGTDS